MECKDLKEKEACHVINDYNWQKYDDDFCSICNYHFEENHSILTCNSCPKSFHIHCLESPLKKEYYQNIVWYCPVCAPTKQRISLRWKSDNQKWPHINEPLLIDLKLFLKKHSFLEHDLNPEFHDPLLKLCKINTLRPIFQPLKHGQKIKPKVVDHHIVVMFGSYFN